MSAHPSPRRIVPIVVLLAAVAAGGWWAWTTYGPSDTAADNGAVSASGTVETDESQVSSVIAGRIASMTATEGASVDAGDKLFALDAKVLKLQVEQAKAGVTAAKAALKQARDDDESSAVVSAAKARVDQAEDALSMARVQLGYATITAPSAGVITAVIARPGENASPGRALATIADPTSLRVSVYIPETEIGRVAVGQKARIGTDSADDEFAGTVSFVASEAEFTPSNIETKEQRVKLVYEVRLSIEDADGVLKAGMPVDVMFE